MGDGGDDVRRAEYRALLRRTVDRLPERVRDPMLVAGRRLYVCPSRMPPGHYASPHVAEGTTVDETARTQVPGIDMRLPEQRRLLEELVAATGDAPTSVDLGPRYHAPNEMFGPADALGLRLMIGWLRPARIVEIGSGYSTAAMLDSLDRLGLEPQLTLVEPHPERLLAVLGANWRSRASLVRERLQDVDMEVFSSLEDRDLLFVDSSHVAKSGSDVNHLFFEVLPRLRPGVVVHIHDVFAWWDYPSAWVAENRDWTEIYVLRAFLEFNDAFQVLLFPSLLLELDPEAFGDLRGTFEGDRGGSFWMQKTR